MLFCALNQTCSYHYRHSEPWECFWDSLISFTSILYRLVALIFLAVGCQALEELLCCGGLDSSTHQSPSLTALHSWRGERKYNQGFTSWDKDWREISYPVLSWAKQAWSRDINWIYYTVTSRAEWEVKWNLRNTLPHTPPSFPSPPLPLVVQADREWDLEYLASQI